MIIGDEEKLRDLLSRIIKAEGYKVFETANSRTAMKNVIMDGQRKKNRGLFVTGYKAVDISR
jgi:DNA-binding response OmpR family regulator